MVALRWPCGGSAVALQWPCGGTAVALRWRCGGPAELGKLSPLTSGSVPLLLLRHYFPFRTSSRPRNLPGRLDVRPLADGRFFSVCEELIPRQKCVGHGASQGRKVRESEKKRFCNQGPTLRREHPLHAGQVWPGPSLELRAQAAAVSLGLRDPRAALPLASERDPPTRAEALPLPQHLELQDS